MRALREALTELGWLIFYVPFGHFLRKRFKLPEEQKPANGQVIVITERWFNKNIMHEYWVEYLKREGFEAYFVHLSFYRGSFQQSAAKLQQCMDEKNLHNVTLVGISSGGLSCLEYLQARDGWERVKHFVSIGSPFQGTHLAIFLSFFPSVREILPGSRFVKHYKQKTVDKDKVTCLSAKVDELVPYWSSTVPGATRKTINVYGHNNLHFSCQETYDTVAALALQK
jgi:pimeloyl-ACP methyl ester carboxylesterase